jgi:hypothetical protein
MNNNENENFKMKNTSTKSVVMRWRKWLVMLLLLAGSMTGYAQSECFTYEDEGKTITGLTVTGSKRTSLTIPATVMKLKSGAFEMAADGLTSLYIENGGNPTFESGLFGLNANTLTMIDMGDGMSVANMIALLQSVGTFKEGTTISAYGFSGNSDATDATWNTVNWTKVAYVTLPAELVAPTSYGTAAVYGRFTINKEIITFCTSATFADDGNNNMLFYRADDIAADRRLHITRVDYVVAGQGILIHNAKNTSTYADLPRSSESVSYTSNMLKGVTTATTIGKTDGNKTNYILKDGAFHPTSGGTVKANKAYLQIPTSAAREGALSIDFDDETTEIKTTDFTDYTDSGAIYDLQGRCVGSAEANSSLFTLHSSLKKGLYIKNGKKYVIR